MKCSPSQESRDFKQKGGLTFGTILIFDRMATIQVGDRIALFGPKVSNSASSGVKQQA